MTAFEDPYYGEYNDLGYGYKISSYATVKFELVNGAIPLHQANPGDAGMDVYANQDAIIFPGEQAIVDLGVKVALPRGYVLKVCSRSGLAAKNRISITNSPGIVDADYRGEIKAIVKNDSDEAFIVHRHKTRICQFLIERLPTIDIVYGSVENDTERGDGGFGSSGGM